MRKFSIIKCINLKDLAQNQSINQRKNLQKFIYNKSMKKNKRIKNYKKLILN